MKKTLLAIVLAGMLGGFFNTTPSYSADLAPYKIGLCVALTGPAASIGEPNKNGALTLMEEINAAGGINGRKLEAVIDDEQAAPDKAVIGTKRLIDVENVVAVEGYEYSGAALAAMVPAEAGLTPMVVGCVTEKTWNPTKQWVYSVVPRQKDAYSTILDTFIKLGVKKVGCIYVDAAMGQNAKEALEWAAKQKGVELVISEKYSLGTSDMSPQVTHVKSSGAEALFIAGYSADGAMVVKSARSLGFKGPIAGDQAVIGPEFVKLVGADGEGFLTTAPKAVVAHDLKDDDSQKKVAVTLHDTYAQKYGTFVLGSAHGWDSMNLVTSALRKVDPKLDPTKASDLEKIREQLRDNLEKLGEVVGQNGIYRITPENHNGLPPNSHIMVTLKDGAWKPY